MQANIKTACIVVVTIANNPFQAHINREHYPNYLAAQRLPSRQFQPLPPKHPKGPTPDQPALIKAKQPQPLQGAQLPKVHHSGNPQ